MGEGRKTGKGIVRAIIVLIRHTTWRCGRLERSIVRNLHRKNELSGSPTMCVNDMLRSLELTGKRRSEFLDAVQRLEKRHIIRIMELAN